MARPKQTHLALEEAAQQLSISIFTLHRWCQLGIVPSVQNGRGRYLVERATVRRYKPMAYAATVLDFDAEEVEAWVKEQLEADAVANTVSPPAVHAHAARRRMAQ